MTIRTFVALRAGLALGMAGLLAVAVQAAPAPRVTGLEVIDISESPAVRVTGPAAEQRSGGRVAARRAARPIPTAVMRETAHYIISCDLGEATADQVADYVERLYTNLSRRLNVAPRGPANGKFELRVMRHVREYEAQAGTGMANGSGSYQTGSRRLFVCAERCGPESIWPVLRHEGYHQFAHAWMGDDIPTWLDEGLAMMHGEGQLTEDGFEMSEAPVLQLLSLQAARRRGTMMGLGELMAVDNGRLLEMLRHDQVMTKLYYAECWSLIHFLTFGENGRYRQRLDWFMASVARGRSGPADFEAAFGDLRGLEQSWLRYVDALQPSPRSVCSRHLQLLGLFLAEDGGKTGGRPTAEEFESYLLKNRVGACVNNHITGQLVTMDEQRIRELFRCPADGAGTGPSCQFVYAPGSDEPTVVCTHHKDWVQRLIFDYQMSVRPMPIVVTEELRAGAARARR